MSHIEAEKTQNKTISGYYEFQSKIYDLTRWSFLFGRRRLINILPIADDRMMHVAEIGCGTGKNIRHLCDRYPNAVFTGIDVAESMIEKAERKLARFDERVSLLNTPYSKGKKLFPKKLDGIIFSYSLSMINPQWEEILEQAYMDLKDGGFIGVVDFHNSDRPWFKKHMSNHHVRMDGHLLEYLQKQYTSEVIELKSAYLNTWKYMLYIGQKG